MRPDYVNVDDKKKAFTFFCTTSGYTRVPKAYKYVATTIAKIWFMFNEANAFFSGHFSKYILPHQFFSFNLTFIGDSTEIRFSINNDVRLRKIQSLILFLLFII